MRSEVNLCKKIRFEFGMTQAQFAEEFGIPLRTVQGWESRCTMPGYIYNILGKLLDEKEKCELYKNNCFNLDKM